MRTRNAGKPKTEAPPKKTPPSRRSAAKATPDPPPELDVATSDHVEQANPSSDVMEVTPETKATRVGKTRSSERKTPAKTKTPTSARAASRKSTKFEVTEEVKVEESTGKDNVMDYRDDESVLKEEASENIAEESTKKAEIKKEEVGDHRDGESSKKETSQTTAEESVQVKETSENVAGESSKKAESEKEAASETNAQDSMTKVEPVTENAEVTDEDGFQIVLNVEELPKVEERSSDVAHPLVPDVGLSSTQVEDPLETEGDENPDDPEEDPEEDDETIDQLEDKTTYTEQPLDQSVMDVEEPLKIEENTPEKEQTLEHCVMNPEEPSMTEQDTIDTEQPLDQSVRGVEEPLKLEEKTHEKEETLDQSVRNPEEPPKMNLDTIETEKYLVSHDGETTGQKEESQELGTGKEISEVKKETNEEMKTLEDKLEVDNVTTIMKEDAMDEDVSQAAKGKGTNDVGELSKSLEEPLNKDVVESDALEVERVELNAAAKERKLRKELEIFVGGLDRDATEEDVKKAFENLGEIGEVRLHKDSSNNKNKGYAFVKFATKELAKQALLEIKNPLIRGKRCRTAPSEDNDMLFLGNICNTWTKETIKQKLKDYGIDSVENINVIPDARHEGLSRGFAFLEFSCHADAMQAYKRLQKPDAVFGHTDRTAKVAFAEPVREPDPEVMAQVKSVFVDGLPPQWNEDKVREKLKGCGEIVRITLARNMSAAKRRDFGFIDFTTHEDAVACIEGINSKDFGEGISKGKVRARLSNPSPKTQVVKGGMCGGFRIGHGGSATSSSKSGRGFGSGGQGGQALNRPNFQRGRGSYQRGRGQTGRVGFPREQDIHMQYPPFQRREMFGRGGWRDHFGPARDTFPGGPTPVRPHFDMMRHDVVGNRGYERPTLHSRLPFPPNEVYNGPVMGRQVDDPYFYDGGAHGTKRPFSMTDQEPNYMERSRLRPRMDYPDPPVPYQDPGHRGTFGADRNLHSRDYYGPDYRGGPRPDSYGIGRPYGGGYPPRY